MHQLAREEIDQEDMTFCKAKTNTVTEQVPEKPHVTAHQDHLNQASSSPDKDTFLKQFSAEIQGDILTVHNPCKEIIDRLCLATVLPISSLLLLLLIKGLLTTFQETSILSSGKTLPSETSLWRSFSRASLLLEISSRMNTCQRVKQQLSSAERGDVLSPSCWLQPGRLTSCSE
ncbi:hypothetical protein E2320_012343 [Naja naja]|nr:hypothetical protein E2320_012343 [Naja naja]